MDAQIFSKAMDKEEDKSSENTKVNKQTKEFIYKFEISKSIIYIFFIDRKWR